MGVQRRRKDRGLASHHGPVYRVHTQAKARRQACQVVRPGGLRDRPVRVGPQVQAVARRWRVPRSGDPRVSCRREDGQCACQDPGRLGERVVHIDPHLDIVGRHTAKVIDRPRDGNLPARQTFAPKVERADGKVRLYADHQLPVVVGGEHLGKVNLVTVDDGQQAILSLGKRAVAPRSCERNCFTGSKRRHDIA